MNRTEKIYYVKYFLISFFLSDQGNILEIIFETCLP